MKKFVQEAPFEILKDRNGDFCCGLFRDDGLAIISGVSTDDTGNIKKWLDSLMPNLSFEILIAKEVEFLDIRLTITENEIKTAPYSKPSASHKYLSPFSCHDRKSVA